MATQTATTGQLEKAQATVIAECMFTAEHNAPCKNLVTHYKLGKGEKQITIPKVGQMSADRLTDGIDITTSKEIGMTSTDITTSEVGLKVVLTDKLVRQEKPEMFRVVGQQMGDAISRIQDTDVLDLFDGFSNTAGASGAGLNYRSFMACVSRLKTLKASRPYACVHHPNTIYTLARDTGRVGTTGATIPNGFSEELLKDFFSFTLDRVPIFEDGNITAAVNSKGAIFSKSALCFVESLAPSVERDRKPSLRATEVVLVTDYACYEIDDTQGVEMQYTSVAPSTSST